MQMSSLSLKDARERKQNYKWIILKNKADFKLSIKVFL